MSYCHTYPDALAYERAQRTTRLVELTLDDGSLLVASWRRDADADTSAAQDECVRFCEDAGPLVEGVGTRVQTKMDEHDWARGKKLFTNEQWAQYKNAAEPVTDGERYWEVAYFFPGCLFDNDRLKTPSDSREPRIREMLDYLGELLGKYLVPDGGVDAALGLDDDAGASRRP